MSVFLEGRWLDNKMVSLPPEIASKHFIEDAKRGSRLLRDALFRANGFIIPEEKPVEAPVFAPVKVAPRPRKVPRVWQENRTVAQIIALVAIRYGCNSYEIIGRSRSRTIAVPRNLAMFLARKLARITYADIGKQFGGRDHTTVIHCAAEAEQLLDAGDSKAVATAWAVQRTIER